jgi:urease accessory protein
VARLSTLSGSLQARFSPGSTGATQACVDARAPLELRGPFADGELPGYYLRNTTAGILAGDSHHVEVTAAAGASVRVGASSASKVYAGASSLDATLKVEPRGMLVWGPHATILHARAAYWQETRVVLAPGGRALLAEVLVLGRLARGERFEFESLESTLVVERPTGEGLYSESYVLTPGPDLVASMAGYGVLASVYALGCDVTGVTSGFEAALVNACGIGGWSALPNGCGAVARLLTDSLSRGSAFTEECLGTVLCRNLCQV